MPAVSPVLIGRMALSNIGDSSNIESLTENSAAAKRINLWYDFSRKQVLEAFDWDFARKRQALAAHGDDPPAQWTYRYQKPADCVAMRRIWNPAGEDADAVPFEQEISDDGTPSILTDLTEAVGIYTFDQADTSTFSPLFITALSYLLAYYICYDATTKRDVRNDVLQFYLGLIRQAQANNAAQRASAPPRQSPSITGRN